MTCYIIVAVYYKHYFRRVLKEIDTIYRDFNPNIIFINNNEDNKIINYSSVSDNIRYIQGSNSSGEFSAWDEGVAYVVSNYVIDNEDVFVFLNDTFCHHRLFTFIDRYVYRQAMLITSEYEIRGELNKSIEKLEVNDTNLNGWISSYYFCCRWQSVKLLLPFSKAANLENNVKIKIKEDLLNHTVKIPIFSSGLNAHLTKWLFPQGSRGWQGKSKNTNCDILFFKLQAIINEKLLSYTAIEKNIKIKGIYESWILKYYNFYRYKLYNFVRKLKAFIKSQFHK